MMADNRTAAARLMEMGLRLVPLQPGTKKPVNKGWQQGEGAVTDASQLNGQAYGVLIEGDIVGIDIDVKHTDGLEAFSSLTENVDLPPTLHTHTKSGGLHLYFKLPENCDFDGPLKRDDLGIEVYTGGRQFVAISDGYRVELDPIAEIPQPLLEQLAKLRDQPGDTSDITSSKITSGGRNSKLTKLSGAMRRQGADEQTIFEALLKYNQNQCDPPLDDDEVAQIATGIMRYEPGPANDLDQLLADLNDKHAVVRDGDKYKILQLTYDPFTGQDEPSLISHHHLKLFYRNRPKVPVGDKKFLNAIDWWLDQPGRRECKGFVLDPGCTEPDVYNLWEGWRVEPDPKASCDLYLDHIRNNIAQGDQEIYEYLLNWQADAIQSPTKRPGVAVALRGGQGTGKGIFVRFFGSLYGRHFVHVKDPDHFLGRFNKHLQYCLLLFADEAVWGGNKRAEGKLKGLVTEDSIQIEAKFCDTRTTLNNIRIMIASNHDWVVPAGVDERRFFIVDVGEGRIQDHEYFGRLVHQMENGGYGKLLHLLRTRNLAGVNLRKFPLTAALLEQKISTMEVEIRFLYDIAKDGIIPGDAGGTGSVSKKRFYQEYQRFARDVGGQYRRSSAQLGMALHKILPDLASTRPHRGARAYQFPPLSDVRNCLDRKLRQPIKWGSQRDWEAAEEGNYEF